MPGSFAAALMNLRDTVKWMIAASSAVAAVLVTGLQIKNLGSLVGSSSLRLAAAVGAAAAALLLVLFVIVGAVRVLAAPRLSVRDLSDREIKAAGAPSQVRLKPLADKLVQSLLEQRTYLLGQHESIMEFYRDYVAVLAAQAQLRRGSHVRFGNHDFDPQAEKDVAALAALVWQAQHDAERLEDAAQFFLAESRFQRLSDRLTFGGVIFAVAVLAFAWITGTKQSDAVVTAPSPIEVYIRDAAAAGLPRGCTAPKLQGMAIGGTFLHPTLVTEAAPGCPSIVIHNGTGVIAVPIINTAP